MSQDIFEGLKVWERTHTKLCKRMISTKCYMFIFVYHIALLPRRAGSGWWLNAPTCQDYSNYARSLFQRLQVTQYKVRLFLHMRVVFVRGIPIIEAYFYAHILLVPVLRFIIVFNLLSCLLVPSSFFLSDTKRAEISINENCQSRQQLFINWFRWIATDDLIIKKTYFERAGEYAQHPVPNAPGHFPLSFRELLWWSKAQNEGRGDVGTMAKCSWFGRFFIKHFSFH